MVGPDHGRDGSHDPEIIRRAHDYLALIGSRRRERELRPTVREKPDENLLSNPRHHSVAVVRARGGIHQHQIPALYSTILHAVIADAQEESIVGRDEHPVQCNEALSVRVYENRLGCVNTAI